MEEKKYKINGKEYFSKERYSLKDWGKIIGVVGELDNDNAVNTISFLLSGDKVNDLLAIVFTQPVEGEIYEEDFEEVSRAINDFFTRKKNLMKNISASSPSSTGNTTTQPTGSKNSQT